MLHSSLRYLAPALIAALLVIGGALLYLQKQQTGDTAPGMVFAVDQFQFMMGSGSTEDESLLIERFENGAALAAVRGLGIDSLVHHWLSVTVEMDPNAYRPAFFWRRTDKPAEVYRMELRSRGPQLIDLAGEENWRGEISEVGFLFEDPEGRTAALKGVSLLSDSLALTLDRVLQGWVQFEPWSQRSINILDGGARDQMLPLPLLLLLWVVLSLVLHAAINFRRKSHSLRFVLVIFLIAWVVLDIRWTRNRAMQSAATLDLHVNDSTMFAQTSDGYLHEYISRLKRDVLSPDPGKILLIGDDSVAEFYLKKTRYYLLPHAAAVWPDSSETINPEELDYVLLFQTFYDEQAARNPRIIPSYVWKQLTVPADWRKNFKLIDVGDFGLLFAVSKPSDPDQL